METWFLRSFAGFCLVLAATRIVGEVKRVDDGNVGKYTLPKDHQLYSENDSRYLQDVGAVSAIVGGMLGAIGSEALRRNLKNQPTI